MMKHLILIATILSSSIGLLSAQSAQWLDQASNTGFEQQSAVAASSSMVIYGGTFDDQFESLSTRGLDDCFLRALDPNGIELWTKRFGSDFSDQLNAIEIAPNGDIITAGLFWLNADVDTISVSVGSTSSSALYVSRWSATGDILWVQVIDGTDVKTIGGLTLLTTGEIVISGIYLGDLVCETVSLPPSSFDTPYVMSFSSNGIPLWATATTSTAATADVLDLTSDGVDRITLCGYYNLGSITSGADSIGTIGASLDAFILQVDALGNHLWMIDGSNVRDNIPTSLSTDAQNTIHVAGHFSGILDIGGASLTTNTTSNDVFLCSLTPDGDVLQLERYGGSTLQDVETVTSLEIKDDRIVLGGYYTGQAAFGSIILNDASANTFGFLAVLDTSHNFRAVRSTSGGGFQRIESLALADANTCYVGFTFSESSDFQAAGIATATSNPDPLLVKYSDILLGAMNPNETELQISVFPSVGDHQIAVDSTIDIVRIQCFDKRGTAVPISLQNENSCSISHLPSGVYTLLILGTNGTQVSARFIVVR